MFGFNFNFDTGIRTSIVLGGSDAWYKGGRGRGVGGEGGGERGEGKLKGGKGGKGEVRAGEDA